MEGGGGGYNRPDSPTFSTTEYLNAFTDIDRSIRNLIDGNQSPHESIITLKHQPTTKLLSLDDSLLAYCNQQQQITCMDEENLGDLLDNEEYIDETSWEPANSNREQESKGGLLSPQTLNDQASYNDEGLTNYEGWIDFEELLDIVRQVLKLHDFMECKVGKRRETEYMLLYAVDITTTDDGHNGDGDGWFVQIPKPNIDVKIFESEILSMAYIRENTDLPISTVWTYDFTTSNPVGVPYAILNELPGEPLELYWNQQLSSREKRRVLEQIADVVVQLSQLEFPLIGSLVMDDDNNCPTIGPLLDPRQYEIGYEDLDPFVYDDTAGDGMPKHRYGPFEDTSSYYHAMIDASIDALNNYMQRNSGEEDHSLDMIELETYKDFVDNLTLKKYRKGPFTNRDKGLDVYEYKATGDTNASTKLYI
ncbi:hypothetical protein GGI12_003536 [Dipsacomyces acuminosporus]|nr:hypothetical protein GGI12_003536 [Dipsacomyces acuminosporus]